MLVAASGITVTTKWGECPECNGAGCAANDSSLGCTGKVPVEEKRYEPGDNCSDLPESVVEDLLEAGIIRETKPEPKAKAPSATPEESK